MVRKPGKAGDVPALPDGMAEWPDFRRMMLFRAQLRTDVDGAARALRGWKMKLLSPPGGRAALYRGLGLALEASDVLEQVDDEVAVALYETLSAPRKYRPKKTLSTLVRAIMPSGDDRRKRGAYVRALAHLRGLGVRGWEVEAEAKKPDSGVENWSRASSDIRGDEGEKSNLSIFEPVPGADTTDSLATETPAPASLRLIWTDATANIRMVHTLSLTLDDDGEPIRRSVTEAMRTLRGIELAARRKARIVAARACKKGAADD